MSNSVRGLERLRRAFGYSLKGLLAGWRHEEAFRQEALLALALLPCAWWLGRNTLECLLLVSTLFLVVITELLNSAIEALTDRVGAERHELSGRAKDMASAAVFLALLLVAVVWGGIAWARWASG
jgi:diacylglycerol kinase (ATP)